MTFRRWSEAMHGALYGPDGFYRRPDGAPDAHFRTSPTASPLFAYAVLRLVEEVADVLGEPAQVVEIAAGSGALLTTLRTLAPDLRLTGVEVRPRPTGLPADVEWLSERPHPIRGLLVANEWLDNVPLDVAVDGRYVEVDVTGEERSGSVLDDADATWVAQWWPGAEPGDRAEIGRTRDTAWADAVAGVERGLAVAVDYGHTLEERAAGGYSGGTLTGFRGGRGVLAIPDGSCDITAHVALDSLGGTLVRQRDALRALGVNTQRPELVLAESDPRAYLAALQQAGEAAELTAIGGLGDFGWVLCPVGIDVPDLIGSLRP